MDSRAHTEQPTWKERAARARAEADEWRAIRTLLFRFGVEADQLDDVTQEAALALHRTTSILDRRPLLWGIAKHKATSHRRTRERQRRAFEEASPFLQPQPSPAAEALVIAHGPMAMLRRAIEELKEAAPQLHEVLSMYLEGLTVPAIAAALLVPYGTAATRLQRARETMRETVRRWAAEDASRAQWVQLTKGPLRQRR